MKCVGKSEDTKRKARRCVTTSSVPETRSHVGVEAEEGVITDLTSITAEADSTLSLFKAAHLGGVGIDDVARRILERGNGNQTSVEELCASDKILPPIFAPEVWAFGVTYMDSMRERQGGERIPGCLRTGLQRRSSRSVFQVHGRTIDFAG